MLNSKNTKNTVLVVEDDEFYIDLITHFFGNEGYNLILARDGQEGWDILQKNKENIATILLDRRMPKMDGLTLIKKIKADISTKDIPVIFQTGSGHEEDIITGIQAGAYYYITKPYDQTTLIAITRAAISEFTKLDLLRMELMDQEALREKLYLLKTASFDFKNMVDVRFLSIFLSNMYPNPQLAVLGISELLLNAIEHGNLNITYEEKSRLLEDRMWEQEIKRRLIKSEYTNKTAHAHIKKESDRIILEITDAGKGFDWTEFLDISKDRATHLHGRGIALSKSISFDELEYVGPGNKVITKVFHSNEAL